MYGKYKSCFRPYPYNISAPLTPGLPLDYIKVRQEYGRFTLCNGSATKLH
jgi:hypothetical protein